MAKRAPIRGCRRSSTGCAGAVRPQPEPGLAAAAPFTLLASCHVFGRGAARPHQRGVRPRCLCVRARGRGDAAGLVRRAAAAVPRTPGAGRARPRRGLRVGAGDGRPAGTQSRPSRAGPVAGAAADGEGAASHRQRGSRHGARAAVPDRRLRGGVGLSIAPASGAGGSAAGAVGDTPGAGRRRGLLRLGAARERRGVGPGRGGSGSLVRVLRRGRVA